MELVKELKEKVAKAKSKEEARKIIEEAGMILTDEELEHVAGGYWDPSKMGWPDGKVPGESNRFL